jgi:hypothetical protein
LYYHIPLVYIDFCNIIIIIYMFQNVTKTRLVSECCEGYSELDDQCAPQCGGMFEGCGSRGRCVAPDICKCDPGFHGITCTQGIYYVMFFSKGYVFCILYYTYMVDIFVLVTFLNNLCFFFFFFYYYYLLYKNKFCKRILYHLNLHSKTSNGYFIIIIFKNYAFKFSYHYMELLHAL